MLIETHSLSKTYRLYRRESGLAASVKSLFHRTYEEKRALRELDLCVSEGEFVGLIGPNGAGKTTLIKLLTGILAPTGGTVQVMGFTPNRLENAFKRQYAVVMGQKSQLIMELTAADMFSLFRDLYGVPEDRFRENVAYFSDLFELGDLANVQVRTLSLGERMKLELMAALLHDPRVLFLDEPTIGLDAIAQRQIRAFLRQVNRERGTTILLTSHYMEDITSLTQRCVVINRGEKLLDGDTDSLFRAYSTKKRVTLSFPDGTEGFELPRNAGSAEITPHKAVFDLPNDAVQASLSAILAGYRLSDISIEEEDIGRVVERIYSDRGSGAMEA